MTMISNRGRRTSRVWLLWLFLFAVVLLAAAVWRSALGGFLWEVLVPVTSLRDTLGGASAVQLRAELASTTAVLADRDELYQENLQLKAMLGRNAAVPQILAGVLLRPPQTPYDTLVVDAGSAEGVIAGDWVSAAGGAVIGSVLEVQTHTAQVQLLSEPGAEYQGLVSADDGTKVATTLTGQGGGSLTAQVPAGTPVKAGDTVAIPGVAEGIEGVISAVSTGPGQSFITLYLQLPANPQELQYIEVWQASSAY